jgi:hypothetical protein
VRVDSGAAAGTSATFGVTPQPGDLVVVHAYRSNNATAPTAPDADWTTGTGANSGGGTNGSYRWGWRTVPTDGLSTTGVWTNATHVSYTIIRGQKVAPVGAVSTSTGNTGTGIIRYSALSLTPGESGQWLLAFAGRTAGSADTSVAPDGMVNHAFAPASLPLVAAHSTDGPRLTDWPQTDVAISGTAGKHLSVVVEVLMEPTGTVQQVGGTSAGTSADSAEASGVDAAVTSKVFIWPTGGPQPLTVSATPSGGSVTLSWQDQSKKFATHEIRRDGTLIHTAARGTAAYTDAAPPAGLRTYEVRAVAPYWTALSGTTVQVTV